LPFTVLVLSETVLVLSETVLVLSETVLVLRSLIGWERHARDQWLRAAQYEYEYEYESKPELRRGSDFRTPLTGLPDPSAAECARACEDGRELPLMKLESTSETHPFYTGTQKSIDNLGGRVDKFRTKFAHLGMKKS